MDEDIKQLHECVSLAFPGHDPAPLVSALMSYGEAAWHNEPMRVRFAIIELCDGDPAQLATHLAIARQDFRDVLPAVGLPRPGTEQIEAERAAVRALLERWGKR